MIERNGANLWNGEGSQPSAAANAGKRVLRTGKRHQFIGSPVSASTGGVNQ